MEKLTALINLEIMKLNYYPKDKKSVPIKSLDMGMEALKIQIARENIANGAMNGCNCGICNLINACPKEGIFKDCYISQILGQITELENKWILPVESYSCRPTYKTPVPPKKD